MNINEYKDKSYIPKHFLTVYEDSENKDIYIEIGPILLDDRKYIVGDSRPVDMEFLTGLIDCVKTQTFKALKFKSLIPSNVIYVHSEDKSPTLLWYRNSERRYLHIQEDMGIESGEYIMPKVLFFVQEEELYVYKITDEIVTTDTKLYHLPLPNIYDDAKVCVGNAKSGQNKPKDLETVISQYEDLFYKTEFNALHNNHFFDEGIIYIEVTKNKNINDWPIKEADTKTIKELL